MKITRRTNRNPATGAELAADYCESGITQRAFCERRRISIGTLQYWLQKVAEAEERPHQAEPQLVEVSFVQAEEPRVTRWPVEDSAGESAESAGGIYEVVLGGERRLRIPAGFDAGEVAVLIGLLEARAC